MTLLRCVAAVIVGFLAHSPHSHLTAQPRVAAGSDPPAWLGEVNGAKALEWVRHQNEETLASSATGPQFQQLEQEILEALDSPGKLPDVVRRGDSYYNLWRDSAHVRGLWRRTTLAEYRKPDPVWETVLDLDALAAQEGENWFWQGAVCLEPAGQRCLIALSRGGSDAHVLREFDLQERQFVAGGFEVPEGKTEASWVDPDTLLVGLRPAAGGEAGPGYPRELRLWKRGTAAATAPIVLQARAGDLRVYAFADHTPGLERFFLVREDRDCNAQRFLWVPGHRLTPLNLPTDADISVHGEWLLVAPRRPWSVGGRTYAAGALLAARFDDYLAGRRDLETLFVPTRAQVLQNLSWTRDRLVLNILDDVSGRVEVLTPGRPWSVVRMTGLPRFSTVAAWGTDPLEDDEIFVRVEGFLQPPMLARALPDGAGFELLKQGVGVFDGSGLEVQQFFAVSDDGTRVPYFLVRRRDLSPDGSHPTLLTGYGGFELSETPRYNEAVGRAWLSRGGVLAVANIRGGGEYVGWHVAGMRQNRRHAYEDFAAVARDLFTRGVTSPQHLGAMGMSNGGLLVGNMLVDHPEMFGAIVCESPLLDMKTYSHRQAGALWVSEFGDPDLPATWSYLRNFSPIENVRSGVDYPPILLTTSTRDDRVGPVQAREMAAKLELQRHAAEFFESPEGGHQGAATNQESAFLRALVYSFLWSHVTGGHGFAAGAESRSSGATSPEQRARVQHGVGASKAAGSAGHDEAASKSQPTHG